MIRFDHLVIAARSLGEGVDWVETRLGVPMGAGGTHRDMGTHNRLLSLGAGRFLEVIAVDPEARAPERARWFELDRPSMHERLSRGPALVHWVARTPDLEGSLAATGASHLEVVALARGAFRWKIALAPDGALPLGGVAPTLVQWFSEHPADVLPDSGCRLEALVLRHPRASAALHELRFAGLSTGDPVEAHHEGGGLEARIRTPRGLVSLRE